jgi:hypothetical protein
VFDQTIIDVGDDGEVIACRLSLGAGEFPGVDVAAARDHASGRSAVLFQPTFATDMLVATPEILPRNGIACDLFVIKASTNGADTAAKDEVYVHDVGFRAHALGSFGVPLDRLSLMRLDRDYIRQGELQID